MNAALHLDYRQKGSLWHSTYQVQFFGGSEFSNPDDQPHNVTFTLRFLGDQTIYDDLVLSVIDNPLSIANANGEAYGVAMVQPRATARFNVSDRSQGMESWTYNFGNHVAQVKDFQLRQSRADFKTSFNLFRINKLACKIRGF